jgi:hypothetical protein
MPGLTFSNELISRDEGTHTVGRTCVLLFTKVKADLQDFACLVRPSLMFGPWIVADCSYTTTSHIVARMMKCMT